jgi:hypothetical protein
MRQIGDNNRTPFRRDQAGPVADFWRGRGCGGRGKSRLGGPLSHFGFPPIRRRCCVRDRDSLDDRPRGGCGCWSGRAVRFKPIPVADLGSCPRRCRWSPSVCFGQEGNQRSPTPGCSAWVVPRHFSPQSRPGSVVAVRASATFCDAHKPERAQKPGADAAGSSGHRDGQSLITRRDRTPDL